MRIIRSTLWQRSEMDDFEIRPLSTDEYRIAGDTFRAALLSGPINDENFARTAGTWDDSDWFGAFEQEVCVGHVGAFRFDTTIPGGARLPTAGYTRVGVLPTHTRRGLLTRLMTASLHDVRARGQILASLRASETTIYGRFGFGVAGDYVSGAAITSAKARPLRVRPAAGSARLLSMHEVLDVVPPIYDRAARRRVGTISRPLWMWRRYLAGAIEPASELFGTGAFVAVWSDPAGNDVGYVHYSTSWTEGFAVQPHGSGEVHDLWGTSDDVELALWQYLFDIDLVTVWTGEERPLDDAIRRAMHDTRAYDIRQVLDEQWLRILDVDAALSSRGWASVAGSVAVGVTDPLFVENNATWLISSDGASRTSAEADVTVDISTLSTVYLGGVSWVDLASSGLLGANRPADATLAALDALFVVRPRTFCGSHF
jgi:predicted acetyltransferase